MKHLCLWILIALASPLFAHKDCTEHLLPIEIRPSGRDTDTSPNYASMAQTVYQIASKLGLAVPPTTILHADAADMAAITSTGGHPAPHFHDGRAIISGIRGSAGILEVVFPGSPIHQQFVRDTNSLHETLLVYAHVAGHYDFAIQHPPFQVRDYDPVLHSYRLAKLMNHLISEVGAREVSQFYQYLLTAEWLQDLTGMTFEDPSVFDNSRPDRPARNDGEGNINRPSRSILQSLIHSLPSGAPRWQQDLLIHFEKTRRGYPALAASKTMNEGWATFVTYLILVHSPWSTSHDLVEFAQIQGMVKHPSLSNPYWLGYEGWRRIWERWCDSNAHKYSDPMERDQAFVKHAQWVIKHYPSDYDFIRYALDRKWVETHNLFLYREARWEEQVPDWNVPARKYIAISRDSERVVNYIANRIANRRLKFPEIELVDLNHKNSGTILLRHQPYFDIPLKQQTLSQALYILAQLYERPVRLQTIGSHLWHSAGPMAPPWMPVPQLGQELGTFPLEVTVTPDGKVSIEMQKAKDSIDSKALAKKWQDSIEALVLSNNLSFPDQAKVISDHWTQKWQKDLSQSLMGGQVSNHPADVALVSSHAPTASDAVMEYLRVSKYRLTKILRLIAAGQWPVKFNRGGTGVIIRGGTPAIPQLELDLRHLRKRSDWLAPTPPDSWPNPSHSHSLADLLDLEFLPTTSNPDSVSPKKRGFEPIPDEDLEIAGGRFLPGDLFDPKDIGQGPGDGDGEGDEEGEIGEEEGDDIGDDEDSDNAGDGSGVGEPDVLPLDIYGQILRQLLELPNLRPTRHGDIDEPDTILEGTEKNPEGVIEWTETVSEALGLAISIAKREGKDPLKMNPFELLRLGLTHLTPDQHIVASTEPDPEPRTNAVVVWMTDTSGSMGVMHRRAMREMILNERAALKAQYPRLKEVFIIYDTEAKVVDEEEFFGTRMGGGTDAAPAARLAQKELENYPPAQYNRFVRWFSDGDDGGSETMDEARTISKKVDYLGYNHIAPANSWGWGWGGLGILSQGFKDLAAQHPRDIGYAELDGTFAKILETLKAFYGPRPKSKK